MPKPFTKAPRFILPIFILNQLSRLVYSLFGLRMFVVQLEYGCSALAWLPSDHVACSPVTLLLSTRSLRSTFSPLLKLVRSAPKSPLFGSQDELERGVAILVPGLSTQPVSFLGRLILGGMLKRLFTVRYACACARAPFTACNV